ncbi:MAG: putative porin [Candidatus Krumholzibacteriia bacterium]
MFNSKTFATLMILMVVLVAGSAMAESTFYGSARLSLDMQNNGDESFFAMNSNASRIGWMGEEELNDNFTAIWQVETEVDWNEGPSRIWSSRDTYGGLKGSWGHLQGGYFDSPLKKLGSKTSFFMDEVGDRRQLTLGADMRYHSQVLYALPNMDNGFGAMVSAVLPQTETYDPDVETDSAFFGEADFSGDNFLVGAAFASHSAGNFNPVADAAESSTTFRLAGNYSGDAFGINAMYQSTSNFGGFDGLSATVMSIEAMFAASDAWHIKAGYTMTDPDTDTDDDGASLIAFGIDHPVTDNMTFYIQYAMISNDDNQAAGLNSNGPGGGGWGGSVNPAFDDAGLAENPSDISLGAIMKF